MKRLAREAPINKKKEISMPIMKSFEFKMSPFYNHIFVNPFEAFMIHSKLNRMTKPQFSQEKNYKRTP